MKLTICLVTKGREEFIDDVLDSFLPFLEDQDVEVFLIDNGTTSICRRKLANWQAAHSASSRLIRFETNEPNYAIIWQLILDAKIDWIIMPGDDDLLRPEILAEWKAAVFENPNLVAFGASALVMSEEGVSSDVMLYPAIAKSDSKIEQVATALHGPAFIWPSLFFRIPKVSPKVPSSRYAFDWWVGLNLLISGDTQTTASVGIDYRVHSRQETNVAPLRRKFFEGALWLGNFTRSDTFVMWIHSLSDEERVLLWKFLCKKSPIYGDAFFGGPLMMSLAQMLMDTSKNSRTALELASELALLNGIFLKDGEANCLVRQDGQSLDKVSSNIRIIPASDICDRLMGASRWFTGSDGTLLFRIACKHSKKRIGYVFIDCDSLSQDEPATNADLIIVAVTDFCESRNDFAMAISSSEKRILLIMRSLQNGMPRKMKLLLHWTWNSRIFAKWRL